MYQCRNVGDSGVKEMAKNCKNLQKVDLQYCSRISDKAMESLAKECKDITEIKIEARRHGCAGLLAIVKACEKLTRVDCFGCSLITDAACRQAASIRPKLVFLMGVCCVFGWRYGANDIKKKILKIDQFLNR